MVDRNHSDGLDITDELIAERRSGNPGETPEDMTPWMRTVVRHIDVMNLWVGRITCLLLLPVIFAMVYEVVARKLFIASTLWAYEVSRMFAGALFMLGAGYALMRGVHIRADFLYRHWPVRTQATVDALLYLTFYFPAMLFFFWVSADYTAGAWISGERSMDTTMMAPLGTFFLILQGISEFLKSLHNMGPARQRRFMMAMPVYVVVLAVLFLGTFAPQTVPVGEFWSTVISGTGLSGIAPEWIGVIMIGVMLFAIFVGFPISFTLVFLGFTFGAWGFGGKLVFYLQTFQFNNVMLEQTLAAVPLFVFMGILMEQAGLMERLFAAVQLMLSRTRGALYLAVMFVSTIFAAATGIVGASVTILGIMAAKTMNRSSYNVRLAAGTITAGGTLGILIPPSIMLVVMGPVLEVPVTDLFAAAIVPGILLAGLYAAYALFRCWLDPTLGPILPPKRSPRHRPTIGSKRSQCWGPSAYYSSLWSWRLPENCRASSHCPGRSFRLAGWVSCTWVQSRSAAPNPQDSISRISGTSFSWGSCRHRPWWHLRSARYYSAGRHLPRGPDAGHSALSCCQPPTERYRASRCSMRWSRHSKSRSSSCSWSRRPTSLALSSPGLVPRPCSRSCCSRGIFP